MAIAADTELLIKDSADKYEKIIELEKNKNASIKEYLDSVEKNYLEAKAELKQVQSESNRKDIEIENATKTNEAEINLRMKFEGRLVYLLSLNRSVLEQVHARQNIIEYNENSIAELEEQNAKSTQEFEKERVQHSI